VDPAGPPPITTTSHSLAGATGLPACIEAALTAMVRLIVK
jgi:hypothetical protein